MLLDVLDTDWPIGLNPLAGGSTEQGGHPDLALGQLLATFARIDPATWGKAVGMQHYLHMATLLVLEGEAHRRWRTSSRRCSTPTNARGCSSTRAIPRCAPSGR